MGHLYHGYVSHNQRVHCCLLMDPIDVGSQRLTDHLSRSLVDDHFVSSFGFWNSAPVPIGSMYGIYANIWGILMVNDIPQMVPYIPYMDPMGYIICYDQLAHLNHLRTVFFPVRRAPWRKIESWKREISQETKTQFYLSLTLVAHCAGYKPP